MDKQETPKQAKGKRPFLGLLSKRSSRVEPQKCTDSDDEPGTSESGNASTVNLANKGQQSSSAGNLQHKPTDSSVPNATPAATQRQDSSNQSDNNSYHLLSTSSTATTTSSAADPSSSKATTNTSSSTSQQQQQHQQQQKTYSKFIAR